MVLDRYLIGDLILRIRQHLIYTIWGYPESILIAMRYSKGADIQGLN